MIKRYNPIKAPCFKGFKLHLIKCRIIKPTKVQSYVNSDYIYFDDYQKMLEFLSDCEEATEKTINERVFDMCDKLTKNLIVTLSNTRFMHILDTTEKMQKAINDNAIIEYKNGIPYRVVIPSYANTCLDIKNKGFSEAIFQDLKGAICLEIWAMYKGDKQKGYTPKTVRIMTNSEGITSFLFESYVTKKGNVKSYKYKLFSIIENTLNEYSNHSLQSKDSICYSLDTFEGALNPFLDDSKETTPQALNAYLKAIKNYNKLEHYNVLARYDIQEFFDKCTFDGMTRKHLDKLKYVLSKLVDGMTSAQILEQSKKDDISLSLVTINRMRLELRELWEKYGCKLELHDTQVDNGYITYLKPIEYYGKCESSNYIVESKNDSYMKVLDKPISPYNPHNSIINTNIDSLAIKDNNKCLALKKALKNNKLVNQNTDYARKAQVIGEREYNFRVAINEYCKNIKLEASDELPIALTQKLKLVKQNDGVSTYYNNTLVRFTPYKK